MQPVSRTQTSLETASLETASRPAALDTLAAVRGRAAHPVSIAAHHGPGKSVFALLPPIRHCIRFFIGL